MYIRDFINARNADHQDNISVCLHARELGLKTTTTTPLRTPAL